MNYYQDKWGRFHHKPCKNGEPSSNNGWLYTAFAVKVGLPVYADLLEECFDKCVEYDPISHSAELSRSPDKTNPPISRDEILGMTALGLLKQEHLNGWNFSPFPLPAFSAVKLLKQLWELRPSFSRYVTYLGDEEGDYPKLFGYHIITPHRNYFWKNNLDQLYRFAFSVPVQDRYFILKTWGKFSWLKPSHIFYRAVSKVDELLPKKSGIKFLKYSDNSSSDRRRKLEEAMVTEFPKDHPIRQKLGL